MAIKIFNVDIDNLTINENTYRFIKDGTATLWSDSFDYTKLGDDTYAISGTEIASGYITIPRTFNNVPITQVRDFVRNKNINGVTIPDSITGISGGAFYECGSLKYVDIQAKITHIYDETFLRCRLEKIKIPDGVEYIGQSVFWECYRLRQVILPKTLTSIGKSAFSDYYNPEEVESEEVGFHKYEALSVFYEGTYEQANALRRQIATDNGRLDGRWDTTWYYYSETEPAKNKDDYWHYGANGGPALWGSGCIDGHSWKGATCTEPNTCENCGKTSGDALGHSCGDWEWNNESKKERQTCSRCGHYEEREVAYSYQLLPNDTYSIKASPTLSGAVEIPSTYNGKAVTRIEAEAFKDNKGITDITIPPSINYIGADAFTGCTNIENVYISNIEKWIDITFGEGGITQPNRFGKLHILDENGDEVTELFIPQGTKTIPAFAFYNAENIDVVNIPTSVSKVGWGAFKSLSDNCEIYCDTSSLPSGWDLDWTNCNDVIWAEKLFTYSNNGTGYSVSGRTTNVSSTLWQIPKYYAGKVVNAIAERACANDTYVNIITIPDTVEYIGFGAFEGCKNVANMTIPFVGEQKDGDTKTHFGYIFGAKEVQDENWIRQGSYIPDSLTHVTVTGGTKIANSAFRYCSSIATIEIPGSVTYIGGYAFEMCAQLTTVNIPEGVTNIYRNTFAYCRFLNNVTIPNGVTSIDEEAFDTCDYLDEIIIPNSVTFIGRRAFSNCDSLINIVIPDSVTSIEHSAFSVCDNLASVKIGAGVTYIGNWAFGGCTKLTSITVDEENTNYYVKNGSLIETKTKKVIFSKDGDIPSTASSIGSGAFYGKTYSAPIKIPLNITTIESQAFGGVEGGMTVYAEAPPDDHEGWADDWCDETVTVIWGYTDKDTCEHVWGDWEFTIQANCIQPGMRTRYCTICGKVSTWKIAPFGHNWKEEVVKPTCTEQGHTEYICDDCGYTYKDNYTDPVDHNMVNDICTRCGYSETTVVYYGVSAIPEKYDSSFILGLENKVLSYSHLNSIKARPLVGEYIYYCIPSSFGDCKLSYNNFVGGFSLIAEEVDLTYSAGLTRKYNIYKSNQANLGVNGAITIKIEEMG